MLIDASQTGPANLGEADVVIVGAGAVGIALAISLAREGRRVTLLEGGPAQVPLDYRSHNDALQTGRPHLGITDGRMKALGGTTRLWGGQLTPFDRSDFEGGVFPGKPAWPISFDDYHAWADAAFAFLRVPARIGEIDGLWREASGRSAELGRDLHLGMNIWLPQPDFTRLFASELAGLRNLTVITGATVEAIGLEANGRVSHVTTANGRYKGRHIVLAAGTFEIVTLLLRAAQRETGSRLEASPHIGRWFIDHLHGIVGEIRAPNSARLGALFDNVYLKGHKFSVKVRAGTEMRARLRIANCVATVNPRFSLGETAAELRSLLRRVFWRGDAGSLIEGLRQGMILAGAIVPLAWRYLARNRSAMLFHRGNYLGIEIEQVPCAQSYIGLDPAVPAATARPLLHWQLDGSEMTGIQALCHALRDTFAREGLGEVVLDPRIEAGDPAFLSGMHDAYHQMGGARMAESAEAGVVDRDCKVFGTQNLYVAGAAVFPSGSFANPTLTAIALALRLSDHLVRQE